MIIVRSAFKIKILDDDAQIIYFKKMRHVPGKYSPGKDESWASTNPNLAELKGAEIVV